MTTTVTVTSQVPDWRPAYVCSQRLCGGLDTGSVGSTQLYEWMSLYIRTFSC